MPTLLNPYLAFRDTARAAMEFYRSVLGGELTISTFGELSLGTDDAEADKVMHAMLVTPGGLTLMAADTPNSMELATGSSLTVSLTGDDEAELRGYWDGLTQGADIGVSLEKAPWGDTFGMFTDRFGIPWMVNIAGSTA